LVALKQKSLLHAAGKASTMNTTHRNGSLRACILAYVMAQAALLAMPVHAQAHSQAQDKAATERAERHSRVDAPLKEAAKLAPRADAPAKEAAKPAKSDERPSWAGPHGC